MQAYVSCGGIIKCVQFSLFSLPAPRVAHHHASTQRKSCSMRLQTFISLSSHKACHERYCLSSRSKMGVQYHSDSTICWISVWTYLLESCWFSHHMVSQRYHIPIDMRPDIPRRLGNYRQSDRGMERAPLPWSPPAPAVAPADRATTDAAPPKQSASASFHISQVSGAREPRPVLSPRSRAWPAPR